MIAKGTHASRQTRHPSSTIKLLPLHRRVLSGLLRLDRVLLGLAAVIMLPSGAMSYEINP